MFPTGVVTVIALDGNIKIAYTLIVIPSGN